MGQGRLEALGPALDLPAGHETPLAAWKRGVDGHTKPPDTSR